MLGNGPPMPRFERNDTFHTIVARARYVPVRLVCDAERYVYMHEVVVVSLMRGVHGRPGPAHVTGSFPSPGEYTNWWGRAVVVTEMGPYVVMIHAVTLTGRHNCRGTQNHVPTVTTMLSRDGAVRKAIMFTSREIRDCDDSATRPGDESRTQ